MEIASCSAETDAHSMELSTHGSAFFSIACYSDSPYINPIPYHWHDELELIVITKGEATVSVGTESYFLKSGDGIFINAGVLHAVLDNKSPFCRLRSAVFHPRLIGGNLDSVFWLKYLQPVLSDNSLSGIYLNQNVDWQREAVNLTDTVWQLFEEENAGYEFQVRSALSRVMFLLSQHHPSPENPLSDKSKRDVQRIKTMLRFIHENFSAELSISNISRSALIGESECFRCFRATIGTSPIQYLKQYRIQQAAELLTSSDLKISDIAIQCGFQEVSYFAKEFRMQNGCSPSEYRKRSLSH